MTIIKEMSLDEFEPWSGAVETFEAVRNAGLMDELEFMLEDMYPEGVTETQLNDLLWFEDDWIFDILGIEDNEDDEDDLDEGCNRRSKSKKLKEEITDEVYDCAERVANEIEEKGIMHFSEIEDIVADCLGLPVEDVDSDTFSDVYVLLGYMGIGTDYTNGDFYTQDYAENHPEVIEESKSFKRKSKNIKESLYSDEEVQETAEEILNNYRLEGTDADINIDGVCVCVTDLVSGMDFWFDLWIANGDIDGDWNQYIFHLNTFGDRVRQYLQDTTYFFEDVMGEAENYAIAHGIIIFNEDTNRYEMNK